jgi:glucose dehydrogenase
MPGTDNFDVVVIGAGVCGSVAAWKLAKAGAKVLILEAGEGEVDRLTLVGRYAAATIKSPGSPYLGRDGDKFAPSPESDPHYFLTDPAAHDHFKSTYLRRAGGTTWHFLGNTPRHVPNDLRLATKYGRGVDWPLCYDDLEGDYCDAEELMGVSGNHAEWNGLFGGQRSRPFPMTEIWPSYGDRIIKPKLDGARVGGIDEPVLVRSTPQARNSRPYQGRPACAGNSSCVPICPIQAKYDATVHLREAVRAGAELRTGSIAVNLQPAADRTLIESVTYRTWDGTDHEVRSRVVVLAAHAIEGPKLLLLSDGRRGVANSSGKVGRFLMDHLQGSAAVLLPFPVYPYRGPPTTSGIDAFRDGAFRRSHAAFRMSLGNDGFGRSIKAPGDLIADHIVNDQLIGRQLADKIRADAVRQFRLSSSTEVLPNEANRVTLGDQNDALGIPRPRVEFTVDDYTRKAFGVVIGIFRQLLGRVSDDTVFVQADEYTGAGHIMGTTRMGRDPKASVVDPDCRSHDHPNLYIFSSSVFPTAGTANPTLTAVALTLRGLRGALAALGSGGFVR